MLQEKALSQQGDWHRNHTEPERAEKIHIHHVSRGRLKHCSRIHPTTLKLLGVKPASATQVSVC